MTKKICNPRNALHASQATLEKKIEKAKARKVEAKGLGIAESIESASK